MCFIAYVCLEQSIRMLVIGYSSSAVGYLILSLSVDSFEVLVEISGYVLVTTLVSIGMYRVTVEFSSRSSFMLCICSLYC